jgi:hypothetical protein
LLRASFSELSGLLAETQKIHEQSWRVIQSPLEDLERKAYQAVEDALSRIGQEVHERANYELAMVLENFDVKTEARLGTRLDQALAKAVETQRRIERSLTASMAEHQKQFAEDFYRAETEVREREQSLRVTVQNAAMKLEELNKSCVEITKKIQQLGEKLMNELRQQTDEALQTFQSRFDQLWEAAAGGVEKRIAGAIEARVTSSLKQAQGTVVREMLEFFIQALHHHQSQKGE